MPEILDGLNDAQQIAVTHEGGPLLIVAGAGTGKTTVLTRRYLHLLNNGSRKSKVESRESRLTTDNILALTFTEKAAAEMEDRVMRLLPNGAYDFWISTFHGFCQRILERYAFEIGLPNQFRLLNETDAWLLLKRRLAELPLDRYRPLGNPVKFLAGLLKHFSRAKDEGVAPEHYLAFAESAALDGDQEFVTGERARLKEIADCYFAYRRILREEGALDFGDLIVETLRLLRDCPRVLKELREQFVYVLVDEFQDTNWAQYELIKLIAGDQKNLTVVGDDDQAIYKFRGASLANILQFRDDFPEAKTVALTENYRSHQEILDAAYGFIVKNNPNRLEVKLADTGLSKRLTSHVVRERRDARNAVDVLWFKTLEDEAEGVALKIREMKDSDPNLTWNDFAVLSRSNDGCEPFLLALERHGISFRFVAMRGLYAKPVVVDLTAFFSLSAGSRDSTTVWRAMNSPCYSFSAKELADFLAFSSRKKGNTLWDAVASCREIPGIGQETVKRADAFVSHVTNLAETARRERPLKLLQLMLEKTGYLGEILKLPEREKIETLGHLNAFADRIKRYEHATLAPSVNGFVEEFRQEIESGEEGALAAEADQGPEAVSVMTVHGSKGLEFAHVFIVSLVDQRFPTRPRSESIPLPDGLVNERLPEGDTHLEEERRLLYVAMTRAKQTLTFTGAESYGGTRKKKPSVFLAEAGFDPSQFDAKSHSNLFLLTSPPMSEAEHAEREVFQLKRRFSFTQLAAFRKCPLQYKFAHLYRIPILGSYQKSYGQSIHLSFHDVLALHLERGKSQQESLFAPSTPDSRLPTPGLRVSLDEAMNIFQTRWIDEWYPSREVHDTYREEGRTAVKRMHELWSANVPTVAFLEQPFDWRIGEHSLKGSVDRIDTLSDGGHAIYDYKTGEPKTTDDLETGDKEQLWIYQIAMEERGLPVKRLSYLYVRTGDAADVPILQGEKRDAFKAGLLDRMNEILASRFQPTPSPYICKYCDFRAICEFRRL